MVQAVQTMDSHPPPAAPGQQALQETLRETRESTVDSNTTENCMKQAVQTLAIQSSSEILGEDQPMNSTRRSRDLKVMSNELGALDSAEYSPLGLYIHKVIQTKNTGV